MTAYLHLGLPLPIPAAIRSLLIRIMLLLAFHFTSDLLGPIRPGLMATIIIMLTYHWATRRLLIISGPFLLAGQFYQDRALIHFMCVPVLPGELWKLILRPAEFQDLPINMWKLG